jgi:hypothetical protein
VYRQSFVSRLAIGASALTLAIGAAGCGGSGSSSDSSTVPAIKPFSAAGENAKYVKFGEEALAADREAANLVLEANLEARAAGDFAKQCATLNFKTVEEVTGSSKPNARSECPQSLQTFAEPLNQTKGQRADMMDEPITSLRVKGKQGYALFHGKDAKDYAMPMETEGGKWMVGALLTTELESSP